MDAPYSALRIQHGDVSLAIPKGVICLQYALTYHNLTTAKPWEISVAISKKDRVIPPDYPPVKLYYFLPMIYNAGIEVIQIGKHRVKIYNREKPSAIVCGTANKLVGTLLKK